MRIKSLLVIAVLATAVLCFGGFAKVQATDNSALTAQLQAEIQSLMQQIINITSPYPTTSSTAPGSSSSSSSSISSSSVSHPAPVNGVCGIASGGSYPSTATEFFGNLCEAGTVSPANPKFPTPGNSVSWSCVGSNGGKTGYCSAYVSHPASSSSSSISSSSSSAPVIPPSSSTTAAANIFQSAFASISGMFQNIFQKFNILSGK